MKTKIVSALIAALALTGAAHAQLTLHNFSSFTSPETLFYGDWSVSGDPFTGDPAPNAQFSQGAGFYNFVNANNADFSYVEHSFASSLNLGTNNQLSLSLRLLDGNTADTLTVSLFDRNGLSAFATFLTNGFTSASFAEQVLALTADAGFAFDNVNAFRISGNDPFASGILSVAIDNLAVSGPGSAAVPEPSTYGIVAAGVLAVIALRRHKQRRTSVE